MVNYACYDKYPLGQQWVSNIDLLNASDAELRRQGLKGKLSASKVKGAFTKLKAAFKIASLWQHGDIKIAFMDGTSYQRDWVQRVVMEKLAPHVSKLNFVWNVPLNQADIRISFAQKGAAWSMIGTESRSVPSNQPSMNLGWIDDMTSNNGPKYAGTGQVVIHEFCHALGMIHEHQTPMDNPIQWNKPLVISEIKKTNPSWSDAQIEHNMFAKYGDWQLCQDTKKLPASVEKEMKLQEACRGELVNGSKYDPKSIMHYFFPPSWMISGPEIATNTELSPTDIEWLRKMYGEQLPPTIKEVEGDTQVPNVLTGTTFSPIAYVKNISLEYVIIFVLLVIMAVFIFIAFIQRNKK